jgi:hypothetical protein
MRMSEQSPNGVNGLSTLLLDSEPIHAMPQQLVRWHNASGYVVVMGVMAPHQIEVRRRQHSERHAGASEALRHCLEIRQRKARCLGHMADRDASAIFVFVGAAADMVEGHVVRSRPKIKMHIDVDIELPRHLEDAIDLPMRIGICVGRSANHGAAALEPTDHKFVRAWVVEEALLGKNANLKIDCPGIVPNERQNPFKTAQAHTGIDFKGVRMCVVPWRIAFSRVRVARTCTSSGVKLVLDSRTLSL